MVYALAGAVVVCVLVLLVVPVLRAGRGGSRASARGETRTDSALVEPAVKLADTEADAPRVDEGDPERESLDEAADGLTGPRVRLRVLDQLTTAPLVGALATLHDRAQPLGRRTDERGECVLPLLDPRRECLLVVEAAGHVPFRQVAQWHPVSTVLLPPAFRLEARVVAADTGEPVGGVRVEFVRVAGSESARECVLCAPDGRFAIDGLALELPYQLLLVAPDFAPLSWNFRARADAARREHEIRLPRGVPIAGRVVDTETGAGLAGARVGELVCDADGRFEGRVLPSPGGTQVQLSVTAPEHASLTVRGTLESLATVEEFRLPRPAWIEGALRDPAGKPLESAGVEYSLGQPEVLFGKRVESSPLYELPEGWFYAIGSSATVTDASGRYRLAVLPWALNGWLTAYSGGYETARLAWRTTAAPNGVQTFDWTLKPVPVELRPARVVGQVLLNSEHWPLSGVVIWKGPTRSGTEPLANARFDFQAEPGALEFEAEFLRFPGIRSAPVRVRQGTNETRSITLEVRVPELTISGRVVHADGSPAADVGLTGLIGLEARKVTKTTRSKRDGEYALRVPDLGSQWTMTCSAPSSEELQRKAEAGESGVDFVVPDARVLRVRVRDGRTGEVLGRDVGHQVLVRTSGRDFSRIEPLDEEQDPSGYTEFAVLESTLDVLVLPRPELFPSFAPVWRMDVAPGTEALDFVLAPGLTLELERAPDQERLSAKHELYLVEDVLWGSLSPSDWRDDSPLDEFAKRRRVAFDSAGRARLEGLAPGPLRFRLFPNDHLVTPTSFLLDPGQPPIEVHWQPQ